MVAKRKDIPIERSLWAYCQKEFPRGPLAIVPFDIVAAHKERWMYIIATGHLTHCHFTFLPLRKS